MNEAQVRSLRQTLIALLDDEHGITSQGYAELNKLVDLTAPETCNDIFDAVESSNGRTYLPEDHGITA